MSDHRHGAPIHSARKLCPKCNAPILAAHSNDDIFACPDCGETLLYETLEHRLHAMEDRLSNVENEIDSARASLADRIADRGLAALRARVQRIEEKLG